MPDETLPLWPSTPPGALGQDPERDVPSLTVWLPKASAARHEKRSAIIVCPGGGYWELMEREGRDFAIWLNEQGIAAFVLRYRLASAGYHHPEITGDILRAVRFVRTHSAHWEIDPSRLGVMGSSAGGHLASYALTRGGEGVPTAEDPIERASARPDFGILCYPVIVVAPRNKNLMGETANPELAESLSSDRRVSRATPPCFIWHTFEDKVVGADHSLRFAAALQANGVPYTLHVYESGPHGIGLGVEDYHGNATNLHPWTRELTRWLTGRGLCQEA